MWHPSVWVSNTSRVRIRRPLSLVEPRDHSEKSRKALCAQYYPGLLSGKPLSGDHINQATSFQNNWMEPKPLPANKQDSKTYHQDAKTRYFNTFDKSSETFSQVSSSIPVDLPSPHGRRPSDGCTCCAQCGSWNVCDHCSANIVL